MQSGQVDAAVKEASIRVAQARDADAIGCVVRAALRATMAMHYSPAFIEQQCAVWSGAHVGRLMASPGRAMLVAARGDAIVGTACLHDDSVRKVFVDPSCQRAGIGRRLIEQIEHIAIGRGINVLRVQSTINAANFYARLGFWIVDTTAIQGEPFVVMQKNL